MGYPEHIIKRALQLKVGSSAGAVLRALQKEFPEEVASLNERTILRWTKTKASLLAESPKPNEKEYGTTLTKYVDYLKEHHAKLAGVAARLLDNDLNRISKWVSPEGQFEYHLIDENELQLLERLTEGDLSGKLEENLLVVYRDYTEWFYQECFIPHLFAEWSQDVQAKMTKALLYERPNQLIETLRILAERKTFKGTCPVCKDWL